jgi:histidyl-tRNA synthetase
LSGGYFTNEISTWLEYWGYRYIEIPSLAKGEMFESCTEGTDNRMFSLDKGMVLFPEVTNYVRTMGEKRLGTNKVYYVARCFRNESTTDSERLREFTQIGVELLSDNPLDARRDTRRDAIRLFRKMLPSDAWKLEDGVERGLNLYDNSGKTFEISSTRNRKQLLGGGPYDGGAGWALGLERLIIARK